MSHVERAARVGHGVAHSNPDQVKFGFNLASLAAAAIVIGTGGTAAVALAALSIGTTTGAFLSAVSSPGSNTDEKIKEGARTVMIDDVFYAAMAVERCTLTQHAGAWVCSGSESVFTEGFNASRRLDITTCGGIVAEGSETVFIGGAPTRNPLVPPGDISELDPAYMRAVNFLAGAAGLANLPKSGWQAAFYVMDVADTAGVELPAAVNMLRLGESGRNLPENVRTFLNGVRR